MNTRSRAALRRAYGGAAADVHVYATQELLAFLTVSAVRSNSPRLYAVYQDPTVAFRRIVSFGPVDCELVASTSPGRRRIQASSVRTCQRTGGGLTVRIDNLVGLDGTSPQAVVAILDEVWSKLH